MRDETRARLAKAFAEGDLDTVKVITVFDALGWDDYWGWPGPAWMQGRFETWDNFQSWLLTLANLMLDEAWIEEIKERASR